MGEKVKFQQYFNSFESVSKITSPGYEPKSNQIGGRKKCVVQFLKTQKVAKHRPTDEEPDPNPTRHIFAPRSSPKP